jgi:hypothetical protein
VESNPTIKMAAKMSKYERLLAQTKSLQAKMEALQEQVRQAEEEEAAKKERTRLAEERAAAKEAVRLQHEAHLQKNLAEDLTRLVQRYQRAGLNYDFSLMKGVIATVPLERTAEASAAGGINPAEIVVEVPRAETKKPRAKAKTFWQKWCFDHVRPLWLRCEDHYDTNLFSVARRLYELHIDLYDSLLLGEAGAEPLQEAEVQAVVDELSREVREKRRAYWADICDRGAAAE